MRIIVTGANGLVGRAVVRQARGRFDEVLPHTRSELDISDGPSVTARIAELLPDAVINCAAYTNVDGAEADAAGCNLANINGVENLAVACRSTGSAFVTISTDYVFDGTSSGFYTQRDTPQPVGVYARSKREGEIRAFAAYPRSIIVRTGWIYGSGGSNFLSILPGLLAVGTPVKAISDCFGTPTYASDLAARLIDLAAADLPGIYHVTNTGLGCSYLGFAEKICELGGFDAGLLQVVSNNDLGRPASRPANSRIACVISSRLGFPPLRDWENALAEFVRKVE